MGVDVTVKDTGSTHVQDVLKNIGQAITFGVHDDAEDYTDGTPIMAVAATHELGGEREDGSIISSRSYLRGWVDSGGQSVIGNVAAAQLSKVVDGAAPDTLGKEIGEASVKGVLLRMSAGITGDPEGDRRDLDETGHLRDNITSRPVT